MNKKEFRLVGFLTELVKRYGYTIERYSYRDLENEMKSVTYATIRNYMVDLERLGYLTIERKGSCKQAFILNKDKVKSVFNEARIQH